MAVDKTTLQEASQALFCSIADLLGTNETNILFDLKKYFNDLKILSYKDQKKSQYILNLAEQITFYDDDDRVIEDIKKVPGVKVVDAKKITDWSLYVGM